MLVIKNGHGSGFRFDHGDLLVDQGKIVEIGPSVLLMRSPSHRCEWQGSSARFGHSHVHFTRTRSDPQGKIFTQNLAAAAGGFTTVVMMANTTPTISECRDKRSSAKKEVFMLNRSDGYQNLMANITDFEGAAGAVGFSNDGIPLQSTKGVRQALGSQPGDLY